MAVLSFTTKFLSEYDRYAAAAAYALACGCAPHRGFPPGGLAARARATADKRVSVTEAESDPESRVFRSADRPAGVSRLRLNKRVKRCSSPDFDAAPWMEPGHAHMSRVRRPGRVTPGIDCRLRTCFSVRLASHASE